MDTPELRRALSARLSPERLRASGGAAFALRIPGGPTLQFRFAAQRELLCVAAVAGRLLHATREEACAQLMQANLYLADAGLPHWAIAPEHDAVMLCLTIALGALQPQDLLDELMRFLALWQSGREQLLQAQLVDVGEPDAAGG